MVRRAIGAIDTASTVLGLLLRASNIHLERASLAYTPRSTHLKGTVASLADSPSLAPDTSVPNVPSPASPLKRTSYNDSNAILGLEGAILRPNTGSSRSEVLPETPPHPLADFAIHALPKSTIEVDSRDQGDTPGPNLEPEKPEEVRSSAVADAVSASATASDTIHDSSDQHEPQQAYQPAHNVHLLRASKVPTSRVARLLQYGGLAAGMSYGAAAAVFKRSTDAGNAGNGPVFLNEANINRLVTRLSKMRGAALKLGQFLSIQESKLLPPELETVLSRVQNAADYMPEWQTERVLAADLGADWRKNFREFNTTPFASASIGQVHSATLLDGRRVAVKIQFPGVADSIDADISNLKFLLTFSAILPKGLYLDNTLRVMRRELADECNYVREADCGRTFSRLLAGDRHLATPSVIDELCTPRVLTTGMMEGKPLSSSHGLSQETRDHIGTIIIQLCLREIFEFRFMQTDPNWSNFLWNPKTEKIELIDFGASQGYSEGFVRTYSAILSAAINGDRSACERLSRKIGYLVNDDSKAMIDAHVDTLMALAEPFREEVYSFGTQTITKRVQQLIPIMLKHRLSPPPEETYSLNRKLSGCFLLCARLQSRVRCRDLMDPFLNLR